jgi:hypothetical protein
MFFNKASSSVSKQDRPTTDVWNVSKQCPEIKAKCRNKIYIFRTALLSIPMEGVLRISSPWPCDGFGQVRTRVLVYQITAHSLLTTEAAKYKATVGQKLLYSFSVWTDRVTAKEARKGSFYEACKKSIQALNSNINWFSLLEYFLIPLKYMQSTEHSIFHFWMLPTK